MKDDPKTRLLREIVEALMMELDSIRVARWENLAGFARRREQLLNRMSEFEWEEVPFSPQNMELLFLISQIRDLEYQVRRVLQESLEILKVQLEDLKSRHEHWKKYKGM